MSELSHLDGDGRARMVDVGDKPETARVAIARGRFSTTAEVIGLIVGDGLPKADVLATARIAGIQAAKHTWELIPLCHQLPLTQVIVNFEIGEDDIVIEAIAKTRGQTGVEMEALTAVAITGLTLHDMTKAVDPASVLGDIRLVFKSGGKRGAWGEPAHTESGSDDTDAQPATRSGAVLQAESGAVLHAESDARSGIVIVASTRGARGEREDTTGPVIVDWLRERGFDTQPARVVADADITDALAAAAREQPSVILTTGGTGVSSTDATPEATAAILERELTGVSEILRRRGAESTPTAAISRGRAGTVGRTVIVNLPGSPGGVRDGLVVLDELLEHLVDQVSGSATHPDHDHDHDHEHGAGHEHRDEHGAGHEYRDEHGAGNEHRDERGAGHEHRDEHGAGNEHRDEHGAGLEHRDEHERRNEHEHERRNEHGHEHERGNGHGHAYG